MKSLTNSISNVPNWVEVASELSFVHKSDCSSSAFKRSSCKLRLSWMFLASFMLSFNHLKCYVQNADGEAPWVTVCWLHRWLCLCDCEYFCSQLISLLPDGGADRALTWLSMCCALLTVIFDRSRGMAPVSESQNCLCLSYVSLCLLCNVSSCCELNFCNIFVMCTDLQANWKYNAHVCCCGFP